MKFAEARSEAIASHNSRQHMYAHGGAVHEEHSDAGEDRKLIREMVKTKDLKPAGRKHGGTVEGRAAGSRADRPRGKTTINIVMPGGGQKAAPTPVPVPVPMHPPMAGPGMPPPGGGPPMMPPRARGGQITAGAASGVGRIEKAERGVKGAMIERA